MREVNKYKNIKTKVNGIEFDSKKESSYYQKFKLMEISGLIKDLKLQQTFILQDGYINNKGKKIRPITYIADFTFIENNKLIVVDIKSPITKKNEVYKIKKKIFEYKYPEIEFREII